jgi:hypothetical protein
VLRSVEQSHPSLGVAIAHAMVLLKAARDRAIGLASDHQADVSIGDPEIWLSHRLCGSVSHGVEHTLPEEVEVRSPVHLTFHHS